MDTRPQQRLHEATIIWTYRAYVAAILFAFLIALPTAPTSAQPAKDPLPAAKPLGEPLPGPADFDAPRFSAHFSADGKTVLTARSAPLASTKVGVAIEVRLWDAATGKPLGAPLSVGTKGDPQVLVGLQEQTVVTVRRFHDPAKSDIQSWDAATGKSKWGPVPVEFVNAMAFSPDGKTIVTVDLFGSARLWDAANGKAIGDRPLFPRSTPWLGSGPRVAFSPDGKTLVTGSRAIGKNAEIGLWDVATGKSRGEPHRLEGKFRYLGSYLGFSPDGKTVLSGDVVQKEHSLRVWDAATCKPIGEPLRLPGGSRGTVAYSPDARTVLAATGEKTAQLWDVVTGKTLGEALPHGDPVYHAAFTPNGKVLLTASGSPDKPGEVRLWDVATRKAFCNVPTKSYVTEAVFSPDGTVLLLASEKDARLWQVPKLSK